MASYYIGLSLLSNNRYGAAERRQLLSAEGLRVLSLLEGRAPGTDEIAREENGRPFFPDRHADFNISHSGNMAAVSLVSGQGRHGETMQIRTGCDIQLIKPRVKMREIAEEFFSAAERDYIFSSDGDRCEAARFFQIWTLKESYLKLRGFSVFDMGKAPSFVCGGSLEPLTFNAEAPLSFYLYEISGPCERYMLAAAFEGVGATQPEIRWFSQPASERLFFCEIKFPDNSSRGERQDAEGTAMAPCTGT